MLPLGLGKRTLLDVPRHAATANRERRRLKRAGGDSGHLVQKILDGKPAAQPFFLSSFFPLVQVCCLIAVMA